MNNGDSCGDGDGGANGGGDSGSKHDGGGCVICTLSSYMNGDFHMLSNAIFKGRMTLFSSQ